MTDKWTRASATIVDHDPVRDQVGPAQPVKLEAVVPTISAPVLHESTPALEGPELSKALESRVLDIELPWGVLPASPLRRVDLEVAGLVAVMVSLVAVDVRVGLAWGGFTCLIAALLHIDRRIPFSFGQGFLGYRSDLGWPQGVQEDDDFRWNWKPRTNG
jgi:hypothetical protein